MIIAVVDDLMFASKISTVAKAVKVDVVFVRSAEQVLLRVKEERPSLVIFDLNSTKLKPLETITAIKTNAELQSIRTLGYLSHIDGDLASAARDAGADKVLARSTFSEQLPSILSSPNH